MPAFTDNSVIINLSNFLSEKCYALFKENESRTIGRQKINAF